MMTTPRSGKTLMIVEDDVLLAMVLRSELEGGGYVLLNTTDRIADALEVARAGQPDLALVNIQLVGTDDGIELAKLLRAFNIPVLLISGQVSRARSARTVAIASMPKPYDAADMVIAVTYLLGRLQCDASLPRPHGLEVFDEGTSWFPPAV